MPRGVEGPADFSIHMDPRPLQNLTRALRNEANGKVLRAELVKNLRTAAAPAVQDARAAIRSAPGGATHNGQAMRQAIATSIRVQVKTGPKTAGVRIRQAPTLRTRGFRYAGRNFNKPSFRHPVYGDLDRWVTQVGAPGWFDRSMERHSGPVRRAVLRAIDEMATKVAKQTTNRG